MNLFFRFQKVKLIRRQILEEIRRKITFRFVFNRSFEHQISTRFLLPKIDLIAASALVKSGDFSLATVSIKSALKLKTRREILRSREKILEFFLFTEKRFENRRLPAKLTEEKSCRNTQLIWSLNSRNCTNKSIENSSNNLIPEEKEKNEEFLRFKGKRKPTNFFRAAELVGISNVRTKMFVFDKTIFVSSVRRLTFSKGIGFRRVVLFVLKQRNDSFFEIDRSGVVILVEINSWNDSIVPKENRRIFCQNVQRQTIDQTVRVSSVDESSLVDLKSKGKQWLRFRSFVWRIGLRVSINVDRLWNFAKRCWYSIERRDEKRRPNVDDRERVSFPTKFYDRCERQLNNDKDNRCSTQI